MLLLNPGPVTLTERVRNSLLQTDLCHRESEFFDLQEEARTRLVDLYGLDASEWQAVLMTGSGTAAVESMTAALVPQNGKLLVVENGVYGERISQIAAQYGIAHESLKHDWMQAPDLAKIAERLDADKAFTHVAVIHHETTTGRLNDLAALGTLCRARGLRLLVDGVSSFGAEAIDFADASLDAVAATANKCLHGVPGASFVLVRRAALAQAASRTYYLDLGRLARLQDQRNTPFTPSVHAYYALSKHCARSPTKAAGAPVMRVTRRSRNRRARDWPSAASAACWRRRNRRWCCVHTGCRTASRIRNCTMR